MRQLKITASVTLRDPILDKYFREIDKIELLSPEEEVRLAELIKNGDRKSLHRLVKANLRFVVSVAKKYQGHGLSLPDLINEGNFGLIEAANRFDSSRGFKFISFAIWYIRRRILMAVAEQARMIKLPMHKVVLNNRIYSATSILEQELQRSPSAEELAEILQEDLEDINSTILHKDGHVSLDNPISGDDEGGSLLDVLKNPDSENPETKLSHKESLKKEIDRLFTELNERQKEILCDFFGIGIDFPLSLDDIARKMYLTTERVRQIKDKALEKLRTTQSLGLLRSFLAA